MVTLLCIFVIIWNLFPQHNHSFNKFVTILEIEAENHLSRKMAFIEMSLGLSRKTVYVAMKQVEEN